ARWCGGMVQRLRMARRNIDPRREIDPAGRRQLGPRPLQLLVQRRLQFCIEEEIRAVDVDFGPLAVGTRNGPAAPVEFTALVRATKIAELPVLRLNIQRARDVFQRVRKDLVAECRVMEIDQETIGELWTPAVA